MKKLALILPFIMIGCGEPKPKEMEWRVMELRETAHVGAKPMVIHSPKSGVVRKIGQNCLRFHEYCSGGAIVSCMDGTIATDAGVFSPDAARESWKPGRVVGTMEEALAVCSND